MTTQEQRATQTLVPRRYQIFWNDDGEYVSDLAYTNEQIEDIDKIVFAVVRGVLDQNRFRIAITDEPYSGMDGDNS